MEKQYVMKMSDFYLSKYFLNSSKIETNFIDALIFTTSLDTALKMGKDKVKYLQKILYINTGIEFEIKEVEV